MNQRLRLGVVGAGFMGQLHSRTIAESPAAELAAIVDLNPAAGEVAERLGARFHRSVEDALNDDGIDGFVVALPDRAHVVAASAILRAGRPVLLEKPMADTLPGAQQIAGAARDGSARLLVGHILRHDPRYVEAARAVAAGDIGEPLHVSSGRFTMREVGERMNGSSSVCFYLGIHDVDVAQWLSGRSIRRVYSRASSKLMPALGVQSEDAIFTICEFDDGLVGQLHFGWTLPMHAPTGLHARSEVIGTEGAIDIDVRDNGLRVLNRDGWQTPDAMHWPESHGRIYGDLAEEVRHFATAVQTGEDFVMSVDEALRAVAVNDAILRSVQSGQPEEVEAWAIG
jgi:predicted dehydrogenase